MNFCYRLNVGEGERQSVRVYLHCVGVCDVQYEESFQAISL